MTTPTGFDEARARMTIRAALAACHEAGRVREGDTVPGVNVVARLDLETPRGVEWHVIAAAACAVTRRIADIYHGGPSVFASLRTALNDSVAPPRPPDDEYITLAEIDEFKLAETLRKTRLPVLPDSQRLADHDIGTVVVTIAEQPTGPERLCMAETLCKDRTDTREIARQAVYLARTLAAWAGPADQILDEIEPLMLQPKETNR